MKGLLIKDLLNLRSQGKSLGYVCLLFLVPGIIQRSVYAFATMFGSLLVVVLMITAINSMTWDAAAKWDLYALSMPLRRKDVVASKYPLVLLLTAGGIVLALTAALICRAIDPFSELQKQFLAVSGAAVLILVFLPVLLPLIFRFGVEKARLFTAARIYSFLAFPF